jgi:hypothetical protein
VVSTLWLAASDQPDCFSACRMNVVGPDGNFYHPAANQLSAYSLTGQWPKSGKGNREGKAPFRYLGRFFYTTAWAWPLSALGSAPGLSQQALEDAACIIDPG